MKERILHFPSGAKIVFDSNLDERDGYALYIWPDQLDETGTFTEEDWNYLQNRILQRSDTNDLSSEEFKINRSKTNSSSNE